MQGWPWVEHHTHSEMDSHSRTGYRPRHHLAGGKGRAYRSGRVLRVFKHVLCVGDDVFDDGGVLRDAGSDTCQLLREVRQHATMAGGQPLEARVGLGEALQRVRPAKTFCQRMAMRWNMSWRTGDIQRATTRHKHCQSASPPQTTQGTGTHTTTNDSKRLTQTSYLLFFKLLMYNRILCIIIFFTNNLFLMRQCKIPAHVRIHPRTIRTYERMSPANQVIESRRGTCVEFGPTQLPVGLGLGLGLAFAFT